MKMNLTPMHHSLQFGRINVVSGKPIERYQVAQKVMNAQLAALKEVAQKDPEQYQPAVTEYRRYADVMMQGVLYGMTGDTAFLDPNYKDHTLRYTNVDDPRKSPPRSEMRDEPGLQKLIYVTDTRTDDFTRFVRGRAALSKTLRETLLAGGEPTEFWKPSINYVS